MHHMIHIKIPQSLICPTSQAKLAHTRHAKIARRANLSQPVVFRFSESLVDFDPKSPADSRPSRALEGRFAIVTSVGSGMQWTQSVVRRAM